MEAINIRQLEKENISEVPISLMASYPDSHHDLGDCLWIKGRPSPMDWEHEGGSRYIDVPIKGGRKQAREITQTFHMPQKIIQTAERLSSLLIATLTELGTPRLIHRFTHGRFDPASMPRVIKDLRRNRFNRDTTRPYMERQKLGLKRPHIGIAAVGSFDVMWLRPEYIPDTAAMVIGIAWACQAIGCDVTAGLLRNIIKEGEYPKIDNSSVVLHAPEMTTYLNEYAPLFHRDLYRHAIGCVTSSSEALINAYTGSMPIALSNGTFVASENAGVNVCGIEWLKSRNASITIAIGKMRDSDKADVYIDSVANDSDMSIRKLAEKIHEQQEIQSRR